MADKLESTIKVDGKEYEVTAVTAETADKVKGTLTINTKKNGETEVTTFNGSSSATIEIPDVSEFVKTTDLKTINNQKIYKSGDDTETNITITGGSGGVGGVADQINVITDFGTNHTSKTHAATITISANEPSNGNIGDIWFKYNT